MRAARATKRVWEICDALQAQEPSANITDKAFRTKAKDAGVAEGINEVIGRPTVPSFSQ
jgi:hypothetical protein